MKKSIASGIAAFAAVSMSAGIFADVRTIPVAGAMLRATACRISSDSPKFPKPRSKGFRPSSTLA